MDNNLEKMRHSASHILMQALIRLYPDSVPGVGPAIENGFYHDFDSLTQISEEDLPKIEKEMQKIIKKNFKIEKLILSFEEAYKYFDEKKFIYTKQLAEDLQNKGEKDLSFYKQAGFMNMCKGPHLETTGKVGAFKLTKVAGAYWKGDEKNKMIQRIYGVAFQTQEELDKYLERQKEAEKRDHRKIGKDQELFLLTSEVGLGLPLWQPKGALIWRIMEEFWYKEHLKNGYELVRSPHIGCRALWEKSGHWGFYNESMYPPLEIGQSLEEVQSGKESKVKEEYLLKPMNCPFHVVMYNARPRSYKELPLRWAECGTVYRYEKSGEVSGLTRVRGFTQDDAHIICTKEQVKAELIKVADFIEYMLSTFGFKEYKVYLSLRDPNNTKKYAGHDEGWEFTEKILEEVAIEKEMDFVKEEGEAAFYGPKLDFKILDSIGREWQCSTLQFDFNLPARFNMMFINDKGEEEHPYMLHRALFGSFERFIGVLLEHYAGALPIWLSPVQIKILPVSDKFLDYSKEVKDKLLEQEVRVDLDDRTESLSKKIRDGETEKIPYLLIIGEKEVATNKIAVRKRHKGDLGQQSLENFIDQIQKEIKEKQ